VNIAGHAFLAGPGLAGDHDIGAAASYTHGIFIEIYRTGIGISWSLAAHRFNNAGQTKFSVCFAELDAQWLAKGSRNEVEWAIAVNHDGIFCSSSFTLVCFANIAG